MRIAFTATGFSTDDKTASQNGSYFAEEILLLEHGGGLGKQRHKGKMCSLLFLTSLFSQYRVVVEKRNLFLVSVGVFC